MPMVLVLGGGYGGLAAARHLGAYADRSWTVTLVDRLPGHQLITRLPEIVAGALPPVRARIPFSAILGSRVRVLQGEVEDINVHRLEVVAGGKTMRADYLIHALGSRADFLDVPGAAEHGLTLKSIRDAVRIRDRAERVLSRQGRLNIGVVGAGYTGAEVAGEMAAWGARLGRGRITVSVVARDQQLLPDGNLALGRVAERILRQKGVQFVLGMPVVALRPDAINTAGGQVSADVTVWAAHSRGASTRGDGSPLGLDGRVRVDPYLRVEGYEHVFAVGDAALAFDFQANRPAPSSAQLAIQEGETAALNLLATETRGPLREFQPHRIGEALTLGGSDAAAELGGVLVSGKAAQAAKTAALLRYLYRLGGPRLVLRYR